ncbi:MAG: Asp-tRNA(Asn)/Glu-tRNA(Gln) amidotransferase subunit GatC [Vampirovibrio sp.]|jgi:aspartyl-tRNA(Asn)/glutamyl-tRNA(Gln) amidotransferase subunit C|nr:Asp-tRNA(Asn)/Glu-tRNA(Gln) amidotransferase subunit GatC [Vampirovibrio sp.]
MTTPNTPTITEEMVKKIAVLSSLELTATETADAQKNLTKILGFMDQLNQLPLEPYMANTPEGQVASPVVPTVHATGKAGFRQDIPHQPLTREALLSNAPEQEDGAFVVPNIL